MSQKDSIPLTATNSDDEMLQFSWDEEEATGGLTFGTNEKISKHSRLVKGRLFMFAVNLNSVCCAFKFKK